MSFLSIQFFLFIILVFVIFSRTKRRATQLNILLVASYVFYAYWDYRFLFLLLLQTIVSYMSAKLIEKGSSERAKKIIARISVFVLLLVLGVFKYFNFFVDTFCRAFNFESGFNFNIILPVGISFYTFQAISYVVDVYRNEINAECSFKNIALYIGFFPQLLSGPIVRSVNFLPQLKQKYCFNKANVWTAIQIFTNGVVKKYVIADRLSVCVDAVFAAPNVYNAPSLICAAIAYSFQLYCDFSGYSDMAIGIAKLFGFDLGRNFSIPYTTANPTLFWKHWHISLSTWLQKYLYIALGGNQKGKINTNVNLMLTMVLGGLWHGANWTFVLWGTFHGVALVLHKWFMQLSQKREIRTENRTVAEIKHWLFAGVNFIFVTICWIFFRAGTVSDAFLILARIINWSSGVNYIYVYTIIYGIFIMIANVVAYYKNSGEGFYCIFEMGKFSSKIVFCCVVWLIILLAYVSNNPFIYAQF